ncbi:phosphonate ABC transporter, permease protein PhnE [Desulfosporosinus sp.]|uniref:phosphonate ABC transporter, permease protein PhnE n=1 Tax=Desulfosporosinus sp. TaxID=157907 RepID=UPI000E9F067C|nr:phosphonate ABC transporter, permease protein PhnE [Desulfosporosinus sp.]MBC2723957.1 phosphonate ABC transporter, permease protein PhnE [Desulfosporosinus sp.]MBC2725312.1 phosphonate ABC transporter, permease protein PhnE [Desulfosporosinus sp.]HBV85644.1 phosphonate ABC transporter, permease protein PhnE [Desulfosporosinus sp.]
MKHEKSSILNWVITVVILGIVIISGIDTNFSPSEFLDPGNIKAMTRFTGGLWPPETSPVFLHTVFELLLETVEISIVATVLAIFFALPLSLFAMRPRGEEYSRRVYGSALWSWRWGLYYLSRGVLALLRGVPELMWALIFVVAVGLGPFPGVLALMAHGTGILGKLYAEMFESVDQRLVEMSRVGGMDDLKILVMTRIPLTLPVFLSYTVFRWECNMRSATLLGFVGAGGIGTQLMISMKLFMYQEVSTLIITIFLLVVLVELIGQYLRTRVLDQKGVPCRTPTS